jgi:hypothetical protein
MNQMDDSRRPEGVTLVVILPTPNIFQLFLSGM